MKFCSDGGVWETVWDDESHNFGQCFVDAFLLLVPVAYIFLVGIATLILIFKSRSSRRGSYHEITSKSINIIEEEEETNVWDLPKISWTSYELLELVLCLLLAILPVGEYTSLMAESKFESAYSSQILAMILTSFSWLFAVLLLYFAKRRQPLGPQWWGIPMFLTLMFLANSCKLYYEMQLIAYTGWTPSFSWYFVYFMFLTTEVLIGAFFRQPSHDTAKRYHLSREQASSLFSVLTFSWLNPILELGSERPLQPADMWELAEDNQCKNIDAAFKRYWDDELHMPKEQRSLVRALRKAHGTPFMVGGLYKLGHDLIMFTGPLLLSQLIQFIGDPEEPAWLGYAICFSIFATNIAQTALLHQYFQKCFRVGMVLRSCTIAATYEKSLVLSVGARQGLTQGAIVNLMAVDAQRFQDLMPYLHMLWSAPMQMGLALYMLYRVLGVSIFAGFAFMLVMIPLNGVVSKKMKTFQVRQMGIKDTRLKVLNEILNGIKVIKLYAWERSFLSKIGRIREDELSSLRDASLVKTVASFLWTTTPTFVSVLTFATYIALGNDLTPAKAFTSISLFNILRFPTNALPMVITSLVEASVSVQRLRDFLCADELDPNSVSRPSRDLYQPYCEVKNGVFTWSVPPSEKKADTASAKGSDAISLSQEKGEGEEEKDDRPTLTDINLIAKRGELVAVIGKVGCGKSSFVAACLGEIPKRSGVVTVCGSVAYAPQQAWIQNATVRDNITFGQPFDLDKYVGVLSACALEADIAMLPAGDMTQVGEKGITLSGGQKQRLSLARSVYQDSDVYLLDDPLSAVDAHVGRHIFEHVIGPKGILKDKVRILVTHAEQYLPQCDSIYVMSEGTFSMNGSYDQLVKSGHQFADMLAVAKQEGKEEADAEAEQAGKALQKSHTSLTFSSDGALVAISNDKKEEKGGEGAAVEGTEETETVGFGKPLVVVEEGEGEKEEEEEDGEEEKDKAKGKPAGEKDKLMMTEETRETGKVGWGVYWEYFKSLGRMNSFLIFLSFLLQQASAILAQFWLAKWSAESADENADVNNALNLGVYSALSIVSSLGVLLRSVALVYGSLRSSRNLHSGMMDTVTHAPMSFYDTTPLGRIVNRFSKDIYTIDETLPGIIGMWMSAMFYCVSIIVIILVPLPYYIVILIPVSFLFFYVQKFYLRSSREIQRVDSISRSPIYGHFGETLNGVSTVRSYSRATGFIDHNHKLVDENQRAYFLNMTSNRWLAVRLETVGTLIVSTTALLSVVSDEVWWSPQKASIHASLVGLAVSSALSMTQTLNWAVRMNCQMETNIVSVERIKEYTELKREAPPVTDVRPPLDWPKDGRIDFSNVQLRYREGLDLVLKGVSLSVGKHEKLGIVGRTGAGKSTVTLGLFRLVELAGGSIRIDGLDISKFGLEDLRSALAIIPQDPVLFSGTLRENLDPFNEHDDRAIWEALERSHLADFVKTQDDRENMTISENGENLSVGQRQLVCMARALLRRSPILVMDEATAAVDYHTDALIQETIRSEFKHCTVLTIAHRLNTIMDYDRILVLGKGKVVEVGTPQELMANPRSHLSRMVADANKAHQK